MTAVITRDGRSGSRPLSYRPPDSRYRIVVSTPAAEPALWQEYLAGAAQTYGAYGVTDVLELDRVREGLSTSLFLAAFSPAGDVVGGLRAQGPYRDVDEAHALAEWDREPGRSLVRAAIEERLRYGVVESKTVWVARGIPDRRELVACFARAPMHASMILAARYAFGTAGAHALPMWTSTGAVATDGLTTVGYPDARYRTHLLWWDRWALPDTVPESVRRALDLETAQLLSPVVTPGAW